MIQPTSSLDQLAKRVQVEWVHLRAAHELALKTRSQLQTVLEGLDSEDTSIIVSGSLARDEFTPGSDIDWTLLIDGSADPKHHDLFIRRVDKVINGFESKPVGREGTFEAMVFSHDLVHEIGGQDDTNRNLTRRVLLLLESQAVGREDAYRRVVRSILGRYLLEDRGLWRGSGHRVPRFLQNDFARYWRTMAVTSLISSDSAQERAGRSGTSNCACRAN